MKYKTIKIPKIRTEYITEYEIKKVPVLWLKFLRFIFDKEFEINNKIIEEERNKAFWLATTVAREKKEQIMQEKLKELGYELKYNFPTAREYKEGELPTIMACKPEEIWQIIKLNPPLINKRR